MRLSIRHWSAPFYCSRAYRKMGPQIAERARQDLPNTYVSWSWINSSVGHWASRVNYDYPGGELVFEGNTADIYRLTCPFFSVWALYCSKWLSVHGTWQVFQHMGESALENFQGRLLFEERFCWFSWLYHMLMSTWKFLLKHHGWVTYDVSDFCKSSLILLLSWYYLCPSGQEYVLG